MTVEKIMRSNDRILRKQILDRLSTLETDLLAAISASVSDTAYDATTWNGVTTIAPSKNAVRDKIESITPNATHTGEVTGATVLTVDKTAITNRTLTTIVADDKLLFADASDSDNLKYCAASDLSVQTAGAFTPTIQDASLSDSEDQTYTNQSGYYVRNGNLVSFWIDITINSLGTLTGGDQIRVAGLPFAVSASVSRVAVHSGFASSLAITAGQYISGHINGGNTYIVMHKWNATVGTNGLTITELSAGGQLVLSGVYPV